MIAILGLAVQLSSLGPIAEAERTTDYLALYALYDISFAGVIGSLALIRIRQRRLAGVVLWATGTLTSGVVIWYVFAVTEGDGMWREHLLLGPGASVVLGTAVLVLVGGALLVSIAGASLDKNDRGTTASESAALLRNPLTSVGVLLVTALGLAAFGIQAEWWTENPLHGPGLPVDGVEATLGTGLTLAATAVAAAAIVAVRRREWQRLAHSALLGLGFLLLVWPFWELHQAQEAVLALPGLYITSGAGASFLVAGVVLCALDCDPNRGLARGERNAQGFVPFERVPSGAVLVTISGALLTTTGALMDWIVPHPSTDATSTLLEITAAGPDVRVVVLGLVSAGIFLAVVVSMRSNDRAGGLVLLGTGIAVMAVGLWGLTSVTAGIRGGRFLVAPGFHVTLLGGASLAIAGTVQHVTADPPTLAL